MAERPALEAVLFDAGGTLVRLDFEWMSEMLRGLGLEITPGALARGEVEARRALDAAFEAPLCTDEDVPRFGFRGDSRLYFAGIIERSGVPAHLIDAALARLVEQQAGPGLWTRPVEGARGCIDALAGRGLRLACVSNSDGRAAYHLESCDVCRGLEFVVDSGIEGVEKPHPGIFRIALERLGVPAGRALYVGDLRAVDGRGARGAGLHFVLLDPFGNYAARGEPAIESIARLPDWVAAHFELNGGRGRESR